MFKTTLHENAEPDEQGGFGSDVKSPKHYRMFIEKVCHCLGVFA